MFRASRGLVQDVMAQAYHIDELTPGRVFEHARRTKKGRLHQIHGTGYRMYARRDWVGRLRYRN